jgi:hypothetical protein
MTHMNVFFSSESGDKLYLICVKMKTETIAFLYSTISFHTHPSVLSVYLLAHE